MNTNTNTFILRNCYLRNGSVFTADDSPDYDNVVFVDAAGLYLRDNRVYEAGYSAGAFYAHIGKEKVKQEVTKGTFAALNEGSAVPVDYNMDDDKTCTVIHAYSYDFENANPENKDTVISKLSQIYSKVFKLFIESNKSKLYLVPLSGSTFAGIFRPQMPDITHKAIRKALLYFNTNQSNFNTSNKQIHLCLFSGDEQRTYRDTRLYNISILR